MRKNYKAWLHDQQEINSPIGDLADDFVKNEGKLPEQGKDKMIDDAIKASEDAYQMHMVETMEMGECISVGLQSVAYDIVRIPGGWIYTMEHLDKISHLFVPFNQ